MESCKLILSPSLLSCKFDKIGWGLDVINKSGAKWVHFDVMDGNFVPPITFGAQMVSDCRPLSNLFYDVHLMVVNPQNQIEQFVNAGANAITFHYEAVNNFVPLVNEIKAKYPDLKVGVALNPSTDVFAISEGLESLDLVLVMSVNPGYAGQKFIESAINKVETLAKLKANKGLPFLISVDGGIDILIAKKLYQAGANVVISGNSFFKYPNHAEFASAIQGGLNG